MATVMIYIKATEKPRLIPSLDFKEVAEVPIKDAITTEVRIMRIRDLILIRANIKTPIQTMLNRVFELILIE